MTKERLQQIKEVREKITPGLLSTDTTFPMLVHITNEGKPRIYTNCITTYDASFIAQSRTFIDELIAEVESLKEGEFSS